MVVQNTVACDGMSVPNPTPYEKLEKQKGKEPRTTDGTSTNSIGPQCRLSLDDRLPWLAEAMASIKWQAWPQLSEYPSYTVQSHLINQTITTRMETQCHIHPYNLYSSSRISWKSQIYPDIHRKSMKLHDITKLLCHVALAQNAFKRITETLRNRSWIMRFCLAFWSWIVRPHAGFSQGTLRFAEKARKKKVTITEKTENKNRYSII